MGGRRDPSRSGSLTQRRCIFISKLFKAIVKAIKKIISTIIKLFKKLLPLILVVAALYFAPAISGWLSSIGAPSWMSTAFSWVGTNVSPYVVSAVDKLGGALLSVGDKAWSAFKAAELGTQAAIVGGGMMLLAPEETTEFVKDAASTVTELAGNVAGAVAGGVASGFTASPLGFILLAGGLIWLLMSSSDDPSTAS